MAGGLLVAIDEFAVTPGGIPLPNRFPQQAQDVGFCGFADFNLAHGVVIDRAADFDCGAAGGEKQDGEKQSWFFHGESPFSATLTQAYCFYNPKMSYPKPAWLSGFIFLAF
jgi:hypothetical protein